MKIREHTLFSSPINLSIPLEQSEEEKAKFTETTVKLQEKRAVINVGGQTHSVLWETLERLPNSRLAKIRNVKTLPDLYSLCDDYDPVTGELFFDKHPVVFVAILNFYRISKLHMPEDICPIGFQDEINFWGIG